jgi:protocatechuate 3,4-dioxygenase beta subunit
MTRLRATHGLLLSAALCALALLLGLPACGSKNTAPDPGGPGPQVQVPQGMLAQLPALPPQGHAASGAKQASAAQTGYISGIGIFDGDGFTANGGSTGLPAQPGKVAWAMYSLNINGTDLNRIEPNITATTGEVFVAVSDYQNNRWKFLGALSAPGGFDLPDGDYTRDNSSFYLLLVTFDGANGSHHYTIARYDDGVAPYHTVSGHVEDENGAPVGGAYLYTQPGFYESYTGMDGNYTLQLPADGNFDLHVEGGSYTFTPDMLPIVMAGADLTGIDFTGVSNDVRGVIMEGGQPLAGVKLTLQTAGAIVYSGPDGSYEFTGLGNGQDKVVPKLAGYAFNPPTFDFDMQGADINNGDFAATGGQATFEIRGKVTDLGTGQGLAGAGVQLLPDYLYVQADAQGNYEFAGLAPDIYKVRAFKQNYTVTPLEIDTPIVNLDVENADFDAQPLFQISGALQGSGGFPLANVTVGIMPGGSSVTTDANGQYSFGGRAPGVYTITPTSQLYTFAPLSVQVTIANSNEVAALMNGTLTGTVTWDNYIASSVSARCTTCHSPNGNPAVDPPLRNYTETKAKGASSNIKVQNGTMPPGNPLSSQAKELWAKWITDGMLEN